MNAVSFRRRLVSKVFERRFVLFFSLLPVTHNGTKNPNECEKLYKVFVSLYTLLR